MALLADRVKETTTTTGTGTIALAGAPAGFQSFNTAFSNGSLVYYVIQSNADFEIGIGTTGAGTLARTTVLQSSNADALVPFAAGVKDVFCSYVADRAVTTSDASTLTNKTIDDYTNNVGANSTHFRIKAAGTIAKGSVVKATGFTPGQEAVEVALVASAADVAIGITEQALTSGQFGMAVVIGELFDVNTNAFAFNDVLYSNGAGGLTATKPSTGTYQTLGTVVRSNTNNGVIAVNIVSPHVVEASTNTANTLALRDGSGNFAAGTITAALTGNASTATALQTARAINGVNFDGTAAITVTAAAGTLTGATLAANVLASSLTSVGTLAGLTVTAPITGSVTGSSGSTTGNAATATALQTGRAINGVTFDGTAPITVTAAAGTLSGATLASGVTASSLTSVGTLTGLTVTAPIVGSVTGSSGSTTGNAATATALQTARAINGVNFDGTAAITVTAAAGTLTGATLASNVLASSLTSVGTLAGLTVTAPITGSVTGSSGSTTGNAATATALQTSRNINGTAFNGTADITVTAAAGTLTGATLASGVTASSLTSVGTLTSLAVSGAATVGTTLGVTGQTTLTGIVGVGTAPFAGAAIYLRSSTMTGADQYGVISQPLASSAATSSMSAMRGDIRTAAAAFTMTNAYTFFANTPSLGASSAVTNQYGYFAANQGAAGVANAYGIYINAQSGAATTNTGLYNAGTTTLIGAVTMTGAATIGGNLTVDTNTLFVDATNNAVGIQTVTPAYPLQVRRSGGAGSLGISIDNAVSPRTVQYFSIGDTTADTTAHAWYTRAGTATDVLRMSVDSSGNLAVDTSTLYVDATNNRVGVGTATPATALDVTGLYNGLQARFGNTAGRGLYVSTALNGGTNEGSTVLDARGASSGQFLFQTDSVTRATLDSTGNLGIGVTPSASFLPSIESTYGVLVGRASVNVAHNAYYSTTGWKYIAAAQSCLYFQDDGVHAWSTAASGTAGNAISFNQAMTLDASGNLLVGGATGSNKITITQFNGSGLNVQYDTSGNTRTGLFLWTRGSSSGGFSGGAEWNDTNATARSTAAASVFSSAGVLSFYTDTSLTAGNTFTPTERWRINTAGHLLAGADATYDIGAIGATRPRSLYLSTTAVISTGASTLYVGGSSATYPSVTAAGTGELVLNADVTRFFDKGSSAEVFRVTAGGNLGLGVSTFGTAAAKVIGIANGTAPTTSPGGMGQLYVESGALKYRGSSGTVTTIANA